MSDYERIKRDCLERKVLWEDPDFPAVPCSVFYYQIPPFRFQWKRPSDIYSNPTFIRNENIFDVVKGPLGDIWMMSCIETVYLCKGLLFRVVPGDQSFSTDYAGIFRFHIWWCGNWVEVLVDDRLPTVQGKLPFIHSQMTEQMWPSLLEKAYAKLHGSYEALKYGNVLDGLADFTGGITETIEVTDLQDAEALQNLLKNTSIVTAYRLPMAITFSVDAINPGMNYRIYNVVKIETKEKPIYVVRLDRPLSPGHSRITNIIVDFVSWLSIPIQERNILTSVPTGFWMLYTDFLSVFTRLDIVHLDAKTSIVETSLSDKTKWMVKYHQGRWKKGVTAGGCRNRDNYFHINPQIQIALDEPDTVIISLNQHSIMEPKIIGFTIYKLPIFLNKSASPVYFNMMRSSFNSQYTNSRQVTERCHFEAGVYLIMPTTFRPREEANFSLRIFSIKRLKMRVLDYPIQKLKDAILKAPLGTEAKSFTQYEHQFMQMADEHKTVDAFDLQDLLERCLPNNYIKSCATIETCRQIVLSMEKDGAGRITLSDFKDLICSLKHWQVVFKYYALEGMSVLRVERLREALQEVGYIIPERVLSLLVLKYMRKDGLIRFGDFVSAVVLLYRAFQKDEQASIPPDGKWSTAIVFVQEFPCFADAFPL